MMNAYRNRTERELIELLRQDDKEAFSALYFLHVKKLKYYLQRTAKSPFLAEDIVHDTFVKIWETRKNIDESKPFLPYVLP